MYDDPDRDGHEDPFSISSPPQKYVEAVTGAKFAILVTLEPSFQFAHKCDGVRVTFYLDGTSHGYQATIKSKNAIGGSLNNRTLRFSSMRSYCPQTSQYQRGDLIFGELKMLETSDSTTSIRQSSTNGRKVNLHARGRDTIAGSHGTARQVEYTVSLKAYATFILKTFLGLTYGTGTLQMLGCIPRSPSPAPLNRRSEGAVVQPDDPQEELRALRARVAELENRTSNTPQPVVKSEQHRSTSKVKREREDNENEVKQKRGRRSGPPEVVDLTAD
ncbi:MAG: hypothetical protein L6R38_003145 [Xanthoria sp. 2 TBL-2021]|nr:MAG: hypothetical protein L6R38_003145 [Xanthoria sp. 2 TBL-2021]